MTRIPITSTAACRTTAAGSGIRSIPAASPIHRWENVFNGDGFFTFPDPSDPDYIYAEYQGGYVGRVNRHTHEARDIQPKPNYKEKLRWNWNTPMALSPNEKGTLYIGAQFLFRSRDHGQTWERISPDLTTNDPEKQKQEQSGGITVDNSAAEMHTTIYSISESPKDKNVIWVGTDDGNLQLTRDGAKTWNNVVGNVPGLPPNSWVSWVQASNYDAGTAYAAFDRHTFGDMAPYVFRTTDYGKTWTPLVTAQDAKGVRGYAHVIKEDVVKPNSAFPRNGVWPLRFDRWREGMGAIQRRPVSRRWRCAIWRSSRAKMILSWPRMDAGSGSLMISRRGAL